MHRTTVLAERLRRQALLDPLPAEDGYRALFQQLQPVAPIGYSYPGSPPGMVHRTRFNDGLVADRMRANRRLVKGRFQGGTISYVLADDLELYANAFRQPLTQLSERQEEILEVVRQLGPISPRQLKEETGMLNKQIMPALHRMQEAFLVYEDQVDTDWDRGWYAFADEWPEVTLSDEQAPQARAQVFRRFLNCHVFATQEQFRDWSRWSAKIVKGVLDSMETAGQIVLQTIDGLGDGWVLAEDTSLPAQEPPSCTFMLHKSDLLVRSHTSELKRRYGKHEVLQYLLIDGAFQGAVLGHWRIGPHDVDDILVELPEEEQQDRQTEIIGAVSARYHPPDSQILRYAGGEIPSVSS